MSERLRVLIVEDSEDDALLLVRELTRATYDLTFERVDTAAAMNAALAVPTWDLILCDYVMPHFNAREALKLYTAKGLDLPFVVVSGVLGEYMAAETIKAGAHDYLVKGNLARLVPTVQRVLEEAKVRQVQRQAQEAQKPVSWLKRMIAARR